MNSTILYQKKMELLLDVFDSGIDKIMREWNLDDVYYNNLLDIESECMNFECDKTEGHFDFTRFLETVIEKLHIFEIAPYEIGDIIKNMEKNINDTKLESTPISKRDITDISSIINEQTQSNIENYINNLSEIANQHITDRWNAVDKRQKMLNKKLEHIQNKMRTVFQQYIKKSIIVGESTEESLQEVKISEHQNSTLKLPTFRQWCSEEEK